MANILMMCADGSEDMETIIVCDIATRAGLKVTKCAVNTTNDLVVTLAHGTKIFCDITLQDAVNNDYDAIVLPGGLKGASTFRDNETVVKMLQKQKSTKKLVAAICAAPGFVLATHNIIESDTVATGYPGCSDNIKQYTGDAVTYDAKYNIVTGKGPALAIPFGLKIVELLASKDIANQVASGMLL